MLRLASIIGKATIGKPPPKRMALFSKLGGRARTPTMGSPLTQITFFSSITPPTTNEQEGDKTTPPPPKDDYAIDKRVWPIAASSLLMGTAIGVVFPIMPLLAKDIGLTASDFGLVISVMGMTRLVFNIPAAFIAEKYGRRPSLIGGPVLTSLGMGATAVASSLNELLAFRFVTGMGGAFQMTGASLYLADISHARNRARTLAPMMMAFSTGATLGPVIGGFMANQYGLQTPFWFVGGAIAMVAVNNYYSLPETRPTLTPQEEEAQKNSNLVDEFKKTAKQWGPLLGDKNITSIMLLHGSYWTVASGCTWTLMPLLADKNFDMGPKELGMLFAIMSVINVAGTQPVAWVSDKFGRKMAIAPACVILASALVLLPQATVCCIVYIVKHVFDIQGCCDTSLNDLLFFHVLSPSLYTHNTLLTLIHRLLSTSQLL